MRATTRYILFPLMLSLLLVSGIACHLIFPFESSDVPTQNVYFCSAQIYRPLSGSTEEFTEEWQCYTTAGTQISAYNDCNNKINDYITDYMAPGFTWNYRNLTVALSTSLEPFSDCEWTIDNLPISPPTYGAPFGAELRWNSPPTTQAYVYVSLEDKDGNIRSAQPQVANAYADFAERTGLPDGGTYVAGKRHIRFSDLYIDLTTPFALGNLQVNKFYIQSVGTIIAEGIGTSYQVSPYGSKFFLYATGEKDGATGTTSFCFTNKGHYGFTEYQGPPNPFFTFSIDLGADDFMGQNLIVKISLSKPVAANSFATAQPYVALADETVTSRNVDLVPVIAWDDNGNLKECLWFENFESLNEKYLGKVDAPCTTPLNVDFNLGGDHKVTVVAYDTYGAYNSDSMNLTVANAPPVALDDSYSVKEATSLVVSEPGTLENDTDADNDPLSAIKVTDPAHGTLTLSSTGSFTYTPNPHFFGDDSFTYKASDGAAESNTATVKITVTEVPPAQESQDLKDMVTALVTGGTLNGGQGNSLNSKLDQVIAKINNKTVACNLLQAFINEVNSLIVNGVVTPSQGQQLIDKANYIRVDLGC